MVKRADAEINAGLLGESAEELYEHAPAGYLTTLGDGTIVRVNEAFERWTGYSKAELVGVRRLHDLLTMPGRIYFETHIAPLLRMQGEVSEVAFDVRRADGVTMPVLLNAVLRGASRETPDGYRLTIFNATERRGYERELLDARRRAEDASRMKSDLLAMLGHDIRTPLGAIMNVVKLLEATQPSDRQRPLVDILSRSSQSLLELVNGVLDYSRLEAGKLPLDQKPFSLRAMLDRLAANFTTRAAEKGVAFEALAADDVPDALVGDSQKLGEVLMNLAGNALKFTDSGHVRVAVACVHCDGAAATLRFAVSDTGIGIEHDRLPRIFEEFTQADAEIGLKYGGTGLGLAISRKLLALFGTEMKVESVPGAGSTFSFSVAFAVQPGGDTGI
jgi:PAS domain S-box-containing protein